MKCHRYRMCIVGPAAAILVAAILFQPKAGVRADSDDAGAAIPVEPDMHEFMEYVFQPTYQRLQQAMAAAPQDNKGWKGIKSDALILAEGGNLLLGRLPEDSQADWIKFSIESRDLGDKLYRAAKAKDYKTARREYETMLTKCNACHKQFADGEHQLKP